MKIFPAVFSASVLLLASSTALAQGGNMMNGGTWGGGWMGGYGGMWVPILLVAVVVGLVVWVVKRK
jgi:uncharacterized membrane protein